MTIHSRKARWLAAALVVAGVLVLHRGNVQTAAQADKYQSAMLTGETALKQSKYENAVDAFKQAVRIRPTVEAYLSLSKAYLGVGAFKNAIQTCDEGLKTLAGDKAREAMLHNQRGLAIVSGYTKPGDPKLKDAEVDFRAVLEISDSDPLVFYNLGVTLLKMNRDEEGVHTLQTFIARGRSAEVETARRMVDDPRRARENFAPDFSVATLDGEYVELKDLKGKVVLLDFWGSWCPPCREATPSLVKYSKKHPAEAFVMIGVAVNEADDGKWREYIEKNKMAWPQYLDKTRKVAALFKVTAFPTYIIIDREGIIRNRSLGWTTDTMTSIDSEVRRELKAKITPAVLTYPKVP